MPCCILEARPSPFSFLSYSFIGTRLCINTATSLAFSFLISNMTKGEKNLEAVMSLVLTDQWQVPRRTPDTQ